MKDADDWVRAGMADIERSWTADHQSELAEDLEDAVANFDHALALSPDHAEAWFQKGMALARLGRHEDSAAALAQASRLKPDDPEVFLQRGEGLARLERHEEALAAFDEVLRRRPDDAEALFKRAETLVALARDADAVAAWDEVLRQPDCRTINHHSRAFHVLTFDTRRLRARLCRAGALARLDRRDEAIAAYREALEEGELELHGPMSPPEFRNALASLEAARIAYDQHLRKNPDDPRTWRKAGHAFLAAGKAREALDAFEAMIRLAPDDADAWWGKAEALVQAGQRQESVGAYEEALRIRPTFLAASARLRVVLDELGGSKSAAQSTASKWTVMGRDPFAREDFVVGVFDTEEEARARLRVLESSPRESQDEALRDSYWITPSK